MGNYLEGIKFKFCYFLFIALGMLAGHCGDISYELQGELELSIFDNAGKVQTNDSQRFPFTCSVSGKNWHLAVEFPGRSETAGSDGTNVYSIFFDANARTPQLSKSNAVPMDACVGKITEGEYPLDATVHSRVLWFALASAHYLAQTQAIACPALWSDGRKDPAVYAYSLTFVCAEGEPQLPAKASFVVERENLAKAAKNSNLSFLSGKVLQKNTAALEYYSPGFIGAEYSAIMTNLNGLQIPLDFRLTRYSVDTKRVLEVFDGHVTNISPCLRTNFLPESSLPVFVGDFRFRDSEAYLDGISYARTNSIWLPSDTPELIAIFKNEKNLAPSRTPETGKARGFAIIAFLGILLVAPLVFLMAKRLNRPKMNSPMH